MLGKKKNNYTKKRKGFLICWITILLLVTAVLPTTLTSMTTNNVNAELVTNQGDAEAANNTIYYTSGNNNTIGPLLYTDFTPNMYNRLTTDGYYLNWPGHDAEKTADNMNQMLSEWWSQDDIAQYSMVYDEESNTSTINEDLISVPDWKISLNEEVNADSSFRITGAKTLDGYWEALSYVQYISRTFQDVTMTVTVNLTQPCFAPSTASTMYEVAVFGMTFRTKDKIFFSRGIDPKIPPTIPDVNIDGYALYLITKPDQTGYFYFTSPHDSAQISNVFPVSFNQEHIITITNLGTNMTINGFGVNMNVTEASACYADAGYPGFFIYDAQSTYSREFNGLAYPTSIGVDINSVDVNYPESLWNYNHTTHTVTTDADIIVEDGAVLNIDNYTLIGKDDANNNIRVMPGGTLNIVDSTIENMDAILPEQGADLYIYNSTIKNRNHGIYTIDHTEKTVVAVIENSIIDNITLGQNSVIRSIHSTLNNKTLSPVGARIDFMAYLNLTITDSSDTTLYPYMEKTLTIWNLYEQKPYSEYTTTLPAQKQVNLKVLLRGCFETSTDGLVDCGPENDKTHKIIISCPSYKDVTLRVDMSEAYSPPQAVDQNPPAIVWSPGPPQSTGAGPSVSLQTGSIHASGEISRVYLLTRNSAGEAVDADSPPLLCVYDPNNNLILDNQSMNHLTTGLYYYDVTAGSTEGCYICVATAVVGGQTINSVSSYSVTGWANNIPEILQEINNMQTQLTSFENNFNNFKTSITNNIDQHWVDWETEWDNYLTQYNTDFSDVFTQLQNMNQTVLQEIYSLNQTTISYLSSLNQSMLQEIQILNQTLFMEIYNLNETLVQEIYSLNQTTISYLSSLNQSMLQEIQILNQTLFMEIYNLNETLVQEIYSLNQTTISLLTSNDSVLLQTISGLNQTILSHLVSLHDYITTAYNALNSSINQTSNRILDMIIVFEEETNLSLSEVKQQIIETQDTMNTMFTDITGNITSIQDEIIVLQTLMEQTNSSLHNKILWLWDQTQSSDIETRTKIVEFQQHFNHTWTMWNAAFQLYETALNGNLSDMKNMTQTMYLSLVSLISGYGTNLTDINILLDAMNKTMTNYFQNIGENVTDLWAWWNDTLNSISNNLMDYFNAVADYNSNITDLLSILDNLNITVQQYMFNVTSMNMTNTTYQTVQNLWEQWNSTYTNVTSNMLTNGTQTSINENFTTLQDLINQMATVTFTDPTQQTLWDQMINSLQQQTMFATDVINHLSPITITISKNIGTTTGEAITYSLLIMNTDSAAVHTAYLHHPPMTGDWTAELSETRITLNPGESRIIRLIVTPTTNNNNTEKTSAVTTKKQPVSSTADIKIYGTDENGRYTNPILCQVSLMPVKTTGVPDAVLNPFMIITACLIITLSLLGYFTYYQWNGKLRFREQIFNLKNKWLKHGKPIEEIIKLNNEEKMVLRTLQNVVGADGTVYLKPEQIRIPGRSLRQTTNFFNQLFERTADGKYRIEGKTLSLLTLTKTPSSLYCEDDEKEKNGGRSKDEDEESKTSSFVADNVSDNNDTDTDSNNDFNT